MRTQRLFSGIALTLLLAPALAGCSAAAPRPPAAPPHADKIAFRLDNVRPDGLRGPPDGLVSVAYEFCVPADERVYQEVRRIDPNVHIFPGVSGRVGCTKDQALCIGETHQPRWREVLERLAALPYVAEIRECFFE